jgi:hypothetical protein
MRVLSLTALALLACVPSRRLPAQGATTVAAAGQPATDNESN